MEEKRCNKCFKKLPIEEFYITNKQTGTRKGYCRNCQMREAGVINIRRNIDSKILLKNGYRKCSSCGQIKKIKKYSRNLSCPSGQSSICKVCSSDLYNKYMENQKYKLGDFYVRQYGLRIGITEFNKKVIDQLRAKIIEQRKPILFLDGNEFISISEFAKYIELNYNIPISTTQKRIYNGAKEEECIIEESEYRSLKNNKGMVRVRDIVTNEEFIFKNSSDENLLKMFGSSTISQGIKSKVPVGGKRSKYANPCLISRI